MKINNLIKIIMVVVVVLINCNPLWADDQPNGQIGLDISHDKVDILKAAIESGALDPNRMPNGSLITPLGLAIEKGSKKCIDYLLSLQSVNIHASYYVIYVGGGGVKSNQNSLYAAVSAGDIETANKLLDRGVEADYLSTVTYSNGDLINYQTPLLQSLYIEESTESLKLAQRIADKTNNVNRMFYYDKSPSQIKTMLPNVSLLYRLIGEGLDNHSFYNSPIFSLIERGAISDIYFYPAKGLGAAVKEYASPGDYAAYKAAQKYAYMSPLLMAAQTGNHEMMRYLIEKKKVPYSRYDDNGALVFAYCKTMPCIEVMLDQGLDINTAHPAVGFPVLVSAITSENYELLEGLLKRGANPNIKINGYAVTDFIRSYPKKRQKKVLEILEKYN